MRVRLLHAIGLLLLVVPFSWLTAAAQDTDTSWSAAATDTEVEWTDDWSTEATDGPAPLAEDNAISLTDGDAWLTIRAEEQGTPPPERLEQELEHIVYPDGTRWEITREGEVAAAVFTADDLARSITVSGIGDALVIVTLVAPAAALADTMATVADDITIDGDPIPGFAADAATPEATEAASPEATETATPVTTITPTEDATEEPTEDATEEPTDEPTEDATEEPTEEPTDEPTAEAGVEGDTYTSPAWGFEVSWDEDDWEPNMGVTSDDALMLEHDLGTVTMVASNDFDGDLAACQEFVVEGFEDDNDVSGFEPAENEDGDPIEGDTRDSVWAVYLYSDDDDTDRAAYVECRELDGDDVLTIVVDAERGDYNEFIDEAQIVIDDIDTFEPEGNRGEGSPLAARGLLQAQETGNLAESAYTSPTYGYTIEIPTTWAVANDTEDASGDVLVLDNGTSDVTLTGTSRFGGDSLDDCVEFVALDVPEFLTRATRSDGTPFIGGNDDIAYGAYTHTGDDGTARTMFISCRWIEPGASVLILTQDVPTDLYTPQRPLRLQLERAIELP